MRVLRAFPRACKSRLATFGRNEKGVALVEFAFVLPIMVTLYFGVIALTMGVATNRKLTLLTRSLGDIVAQDTNMTTAEEADVFAAARVIMSPYDSSSTALTLMQVSSVRIRTNGTACVEWSRKLLGGSTGAGRGTGDVVTASIPADLRVPDTWLIWPETTYSYTPVVGEGITGVIHMASQLFMRPRQSLTVTYNGVANTCPL
jgi:Flp pilus assembly protein TadG